MTILKRSPVLYLAIANVMALAVLLSPTDARAGDSEECTTGGLCLCHDWTPEPGCYETLLPESNCSTSNECHGEA